MNQLLSLNEEPLSPQIEKEERHEGRNGEIRFFRMSVFSHDIGDFPLRMRFGFALPAGEGPFPGLLHLHGGAQCADPEVALAWAEKGYATLCPDWSGPAGRANADHPTLWPKDFPKIFDVNPPPEDAAIGHVVRGVRRCLSFLCGHDQVNPERIGMCGISWGGLMTWLVNGTDTRLRCAVAVYGCGLAKDRPAPEPWRKAFQPEQFADSQHAPIFYVNGTHDFFGHLDTAEALLARLRVPYRRLYVPNEDHGLSPEARESVHAWLHAHLHGNGNIPGEPKIDAPDAQHYHAATASRSSVFRKWDSPDLPTFGTHYVTRRNPEGFHFSSPLQHLPDRPPKPATTIYDPDRDGREPLFLRWQLENLRIHAPETARLVRAEAGGIQLEPPAASMIFFVRVDTPKPPGTKALRLQLHAPSAYQLEIQAYREPTVEESARWTHPPLIGKPEASADLHLMLKSFAGPPPEAESLAPEKIGVIQIILHATPSAPTPFRLIRLEWGSSS